MILTFSQKLNLACLFSCTRYQNIKIQIICWPLGCFFDPPRTPPARWPFTTNFNMEIRKCVFLHLNSHFNKKRKLNLIGTKMGPLDVDFTELGGPIPLLNILNFSESSFLVNFLFLTRFIFMMFYEIYHLKCRILSVL